MPKHSILLLTPWVPYPVTGACQQDRFFGMKQMKSMGYDIHVIAKIHDFQNRKTVEEAFRTIDIPLTLVPHLRHPWKALLRNAPKAIVNPALLDGAALEYLDRNYLATVKNAIETIKPNILWLEYSMLWPLLRELKPYGIPMIMKSSLNEAKNCMDEHGRSLLSRLKAIPKYFGERIVAREADLVLAITPDEEKWYRSLGATTTDVLPLRGLSQCMREKTHVDKDVLDIVFLSSNYNMGHNRDALLFLLQKIVPLLRKECRGQFVLHLTGSKFPEQCKKFLGDDVRYEGFVDDLGAFLGTMDLALCPWISGHGMQQKVFEPLCRSLPLLTTKTAGYPFADREEVMLCDTPEEYVAAFKALRSAAARATLASKAHAKAKTLFDAEALQRVVQSALDRVTNTASSRMIGA